MWIRKPGKRPKVPSGEMFAGNGEKFDRAGQTFGQRLNIMSEKKAINRIISEDAMKDSIVRSGYLIEQRTEQLLFEKGFFVQTNPAYKDLTTGKSREYDIHAISAHFINRKSTDDIIFPILICECVNNPQPIVFFTKKSLIHFMHYEEAKYTGIPVDFWQKGNKISFAEFVKMENYHHYCSETVATQYCSFNFIRKDNKEYWVASHVEEHHNVFDSLVKALESNMEEHKWKPPEEEGGEHVNIQIYYPVAIFQGNIYEAFLKDESLILENVEHIQLRKETYLYEENESKTYQIDVISERYLAKYLDIIENEMKKILYYFRRKRHIVKLSIDKIVQEAKSLEVKPAS